MGHKHQLNFGLYFVSVLGHWMKELCCTFYLISADSDGTFWAF